MIKLKHIAMATMLTCGFGFAHAQASSVTIYGLIDTGVEYLTNVNAAGGSLTRVPSLTGLLPSRVGFRGSEDLGNGLSAVMTLESGLLIDTGELGQGGRLFGRQSYVGLSSRDYGTLTLGRIYTMTFYASLAETMSGGLYSAASLDSYIANARADNAIGYLGRFGGMTVGATYSLGRDAVGVPNVPNPGATLCPGESATDSKACKEWSGMLKYDTSSWGAAVSYDELNGGPGETLGLVSSSFKDKRALLNGWAMVGPVRVNAGVVNRHRNTATDLKSNLWFIGGSVPVAPNLTVAAQIQRLDVKNSDNDTDMFVVRAIYDLSKRTAAYAMLGHGRNSGTAARSISAGASVGAGMSQSGVMVGLRHTF